MIDKEAVVEVKGLNILTTVQNLTALIIEQEAEEYIKANKYIEFDEDGETEWFYADLRGLVTAYAMIIRDGLSGPNTKAFTKRLWKTVLKEANYTKEFNKMLVKYGEDARSDDELYLRFYGEVTTPFPY